MLACKHRLVGTVDLDDFSGSTDQLILALLEELGGLPPPASPQVPLRTRRPAARARSASIPVNVERLRDDLEEAWWALETVRD